MNNKGFIEKLESRKDWKSSLSDSFNEGYKGGIGFALDLATKIDDSKKIIFKQHEKFVVNWLQSHEDSSDLIDLYSEIEYATDSDGFISDKWCYPSEFYDWLSWDTDKLFILADAMRYGYEVEKEQLYRIPLPNLVTSYGEQQFLSFDENINTYFASRKRNHLKQTFTLSEIEDMPEEYKKFAVKVED